MMLLPIGLLSSRRGLRSLLFLVGVSLRICRTMVPEGNSAEYG